MKICTKCGKDKPLDEFGKQKGGRDGLRSWCRKCRLIYQQEYKLKYPEKVREMNKKSHKKYCDKPESKRKAQEYYREHLEENRKKARRYYYRHHSKMRERDWEYQGIPATVEKYNKLLYLQKGCCAVCGKHQSQLKKSLAFDHNHTTGQLRGLLCSKCNLGVACAEENIETLKDMIRYLIFWGKNDD